MKKLIFILFVLLEFSLSFAECGSANFNVSTGSLTGVVSECPSGRITSYYQYGGFYTNCRVVGVDQGGSSVRACSWFSSDNKLNFCGTDYDCQIRYNCTLFCSTQCDIDSLQCVNGGNRWEILGTATTCGGKGCKTCDTTMHCISYNNPNRCMDIPASSEITCVNGQCSGLPGSIWYSSYEKNCTNECGAIENTTLSSDTVFMVGKTCNDTVACSPKTYCSDFENGTYFLWKKCFVGNETVGNVDERGNFVQIEYSDIGRCAENGYPSSNYPNSGDYASGSGGVTGGYGGGYGGGSGGGDSPDGIPPDCALYGVGCDPDTTDYSDPNNQGPGGCTCESWDGLNTVSIIKCKDGTQRTIYMSCKDWAAQQSGAGTPPSSSPSSGGGVIGQY